MLSTLLLSCDNGTVSELSGQPCNKSDIPVKLITSCSKLVKTLGKLVRTQLVDGLSIDLLQVVRFLRGNQIIYQYCCDLVL